MTATRYRLRGLALVIATILLAGCSSTTPSASPGASSDLHLVQAGCVSVGTIQQPQFTEISSSNESGGIFGIIWTEAAKRLGLKQCPALFDFAALIPALQSGRIDMIGAGFSQTQTRGQIFYFSPPDLWAPEAIAVKTSNLGHLTSYEQAIAENLTLGAQQGFFEIGLWQQMGVKFKSYDSSEACMQDVVNGGIYGCAGVLVRLPYDVSQDPSGPFKDLSMQSINGPSVQADLNGWVFNKNNPALAIAMDQQMTNLWRDGTVGKTWDQVFGVGKHDLLTNPPDGYQIYVQGPWEDGATPPAPATYPTVKTITSGTLTVGIPQSSKLVGGTGATLTGPEGQLITFVAGKLGLKVNAVAVADPAAAVRGGQVDVIAGGIPATAASAQQFWQTTPTAFSPDYIFVKPGDGGAYPAYTSWADAAKVAPLAVIDGSPRIADLTKDGDKFTTFADAGAALTAVVSGAASGFVGTTVDFLAAVAADANLQKAGLGFVRNNNIYTSGVTYAWGVKGDNGQLLDALNQGIAAAWQQRLIANYYQTAFPGANVTAILAPGPTAIGTSFSASKDYFFRGMWVPGPWAQVPGYVK